MSKDTPVAGSFDCVAWNRVCQMAKRYADALPPANHDEGPPLWKGTLTATIPPNDMDKPTERAPLFTRWDMYDDGTPYEDPGGLYVHHADVMAKIASGELRVVKTCKYTVNYKDYKCCSACDFRSNPIEWGPLTGNDMWRFCPGCGAEIVN